MTQTIANIDPQYMTVGELAEHGMTVITAAEVAEGDRLSLYGDVVVDPEYRDIALADWPAKVEFVQTHADGRVRVDFFGLTGVVFQPWHRLVKRP